MITINVTPGSGEWSLETDKKHVLSISMPPIEGSPRYRKTVMAEHGSCSSGYYSPSISNLFVQNNFSRRSSTDSLPLLRITSSSMPAHISRWSAVSFLHFQSSTRHPRQPLRLVLRPLKGASFIIINSSRQPSSRRSLSCFSS